MIIAHRDLNAFERSLEQGCALHGRVIRRKAGGYEVLINGSKAFLPNACVLKSEDAPLPRKYLGWFVVQTLASPDERTFDGGERGVKVVRVRAGNAARGRTGARLPDRGQ